MVSRCFVNICITTLCVCLEKQKKKKECFVMTNITVIYRKNLYQGLYEYDLPLFNSSPCKFDFVQPEDCDYDNPWKESFKQLYHGVHVRQGYQKHASKVG